MCDTVQHELREAVIEKVKWNVNRDSPEDKLRDYLEWMKAVKHDTMHHVSCCVCVCVCEVWTGVCVCVCVCMIKSL